MTSRVRARPDGLIVRASGDELLVLDTRADRIHQLNATASLIWSHLEAGSAQDNLPTRVRAFSPSADGDAISDAELSDRIGGWEEPQRPLVLLLACGSARKRLGELTSLVDALLIVGAAGVAGTEWDVDAERATRFGSWIIDGMLDATKPQRLGEVVRGYVHQALRKRDALPFVFTVYGDADLTAGRVQP